MKSAIILQKKSVTKKSLKALRDRLHYGHIFILLQNKYEGTIPYKTIHLIPVANKKDIPKAMDKIFEEHPEKVFFPFFQGDANSKYMLRCFNKTFGTSVSPKLFRLKNEMNNFLGEDARKHSIRVKYDELMDMTYDQVREKVGDSFILKPVNASASLLNFKVTSGQQLGAAKKKLKRKYTYILEEYIDGELFSLDFFMDGEDAYLLCFAREISFSELLEKFSPHYKSKYYNILNDDFRHFLPIRYTLDFAKMSKLEFNFVNGLVKKLRAIKYHGFIHLEYKLDKKEKKIGFIEWGARLGGRRGKFIERMYNITAENLGYDLIHKQDRSRFAKKNGLYVVRHRYKDLNIVGIKTNVFKKTHIMELLNHIPNFLNESYEDYIREYLKENFKVKVGNIDFLIKTSSDYNVYPFYERSDTKFDYYMEMTDTMFNRFVKKKETILEKLVFHDF